MYMSHPDQPGANSGGEFSVTRRGYNPVQVDEHLRYLHAQLSMLAADRDAMSDQCDRMLGDIGSARAETEQLRGRLRLLALHPLSAEGITERARLTLELATEEAELVREGAQREARALVDRASVEHMRNERERHRLERERADIASEHVQAGQALANAHQEADRIVGEMSAARDASERELAASIAARWEEADAEAERTETTHRVEAERLLAQARQQAEHVISQARHVAAGVTRSAEDDRAEATAVLENARETAARITETAHAEAERVLDGARHAGGDLIERAQQRSDALSDLDIGTFSRLAGLRGMLDDCIAQAGESPVGHTADARLDQQPTVPSNASDASWPTPHEAVGEPLSAGRGTASLPGLLPHEAQRSANSGGAGSTMPVSGDDPRRAQFGNTHSANAQSGNIQSANTEQMWSRSPVAQDQLSERPSSTDEAGEPVSTPASRRDTPDPGQRFGGGRDLRRFLRYRNGADR
jgi:cell division septum initiation protein DivIVA